MRPSPSRPRGCGTTAASLTIFFTIVVVVLISSGVYFSVAYFGLPEDDRPTFEWFGKSEPWAPPTRTSPRRQELKPNTYFGM